MGLNHSLDGCRRHYIECYCSRNGSFGIYIPAKVLSLDDKQAEDGGTRPNKAPLAGITEQSSSGDTKIEFRGYLPLRGDFDVASGRGRPPGKSSSPKVSRQVDRFGRMSVVSNGLCKHGARRAAGGAGGPSGIPV